MSPPVTAREALVAEAIGDLTQLLERAEALQLRLSEVQAGLDATGAELGQQLDAHRQQLQRLGDQTRVRAATYIAQKADEAARRVVESQTRTTPKDSAFTDLDVTLRRLQREDRPRLIGVIVGSAALAALLSAALTVTLLTLVQRS